MSLFDRLLQRLPPFMRWFFAPRLAVADTPVPAPIPTPSSASDDIDQDVFEFPPAEGDPFEIDAAVPDEPEPVEAVSEDDFLLDAPSSLADLAASVIGEEFTPFVMRPEDGHVVVFNELTRRGMQSFVVPMGRFITEWVKGIGQTVTYPLEDGKSGMMMRGAPVSDFTELVEAVVSTAACAPPLCLPHHHLPVPAALSSGDRPRDHPSHLPHQRRRLTADAAPPEEHSELPPGNGSRCSRRGACCFHPSLD